MLVDMYDDQCSFKPCDLLVLLLFILLLLRRVAAKLLHECFVSTTPSAVMCYYADMQVETSYAYSGEILAV